MALRKNAGVLPLRCAPVGMTLFGGGVECLKNKQQQLQQQQVQVQLQLQPQPQLQPQIPTG